MVPSCSGGMNMDERPFDEDLRDSKPGPRNGRYIRNTPSAVDGNGQNASGRITSRQLSAIFAIARERKMSNGDVRDLAKEMFSKNIDYLAKSEASSLIDHLLAQ